MKPATKITIPLALSLALGSAGWWLGSRSIKATPALQSPSEVSGAELSPTALEREFRELLKLAPQDWPDRLRRAFKQKNNDEIKWVAERWAAHDPVSLLAFTQSAEGLGFHGDYVPGRMIVQDCFDDWLRGDMTGALAAVERLTAEFHNYEDPISLGVWLEILPSLMRVDPTRGIQFLVDHPDVMATGGLSLDEYRNLAPLVPGMPACGGRPPLMHSIFYAIRHDPEREKGQKDGLAWLEKLDPVQRLEAVPDLPSLDREYPDREEAEKVHSLLKKAFPPEALAALDGKIDGIAEPKKIGLLAQLHVLHDPKAAMDWAAGLKGQDKLTALTGILEVNVPDKVEGAGAFLEQFPLGPLHNRALSKIISNLLAAAGPRPVADWLISLPNARDTNAGIAQMMANWTRNQPSDCLTWVGSLPPGPLRLKAASEVLNGVHSDADRLPMVARLPESFGVEVLNHFWGNLMRGDFRSLAEAAAQHPPGLIREAAMLNASRGAYRVFSGYNQAWLDWASVLPMPADRAAALRGAEAIGDSAYWGEGIRKKAGQQLIGNGL
ncbi:MAG: hypothetical protein JWM59_1595 [Verrucomicrobiales bacterium]|nr:hypothetical protein [Verrucomicrobiales bacterium]